MRRREGNRKKNIASDDDLPVEKWLVSYRNPASKKHPGGSVFIRQSMPQVIMKFMIPF